MHLLDSIEYWLYLLGLLIQPPHEQGLAGRYGYPGDRWGQPGSYACQKTIIKNHGTAAWKDMLSSGVAHRDIPCGTPLIVCAAHTERCARVYVVDRGPFGALDKNGKWHVRKKLKEGESYRGILDMLPKPSRSIGIIGIHKISLWVLPRWGIKNKTKVGKGGFL